MPINPVNSTAFGRFLRFWRSVKHISQEELADRVSTSARHISRLENGSGRPSETLVKELADALELGVRDRSNLLISIGLKPDEVPRSFHAPELKWLRKAMLLTLQALDPHPAAILDRSANLLMVNRGWVAFYCSQLPAGIVEAATNHYHFMFDRNAAERLLLDWETTFSIVFMSLYQESLFGDNRDLDMLTAALQRNRDIPDDWAQRAAAYEPMASFRLRMMCNGVERRFFSVNSLVGASGPARFISEPHLTINCLHPEDEMFDLAELATERVTHPLLFY